MIEKNISSEMNKRIIEGEKEEWEKIEKKSNKSKIENWSKE